MTRILKNKELANTRLATNYGGWMYCDKCNENIGYLCYSTYDRLELKYKCNCGSQGSAILDFEDSKVGKECNDELIIGVRIDIWTHFMRGCIMKLCTPI